MATFIGNVEAKLDAKGRVFVPASYRKLLVCREKEQLVVRKDPDMNCLILYPENVWNKKVETLQANLDEWNFEDQMLLSQFVSDAEWLDMDSQGRILLNKKMLQLIQAESEVLFVGMLDRIAIWSKEGYEKTKFSSGDFAKRLSEKMKKTSANE
jgi:MraZ protein